MLINNLTKIDNKIFDIYVQLDELSGASPTPEDKLQILNLNNKLWELKIERFRAEVDLDKAVNNILTKAFPVVSNTKQSEPVKLFHCKNTKKEQVLNCLKENGPQTSFQVAQNLGWTYSQARAAMGALMKHNFVKLINNDSPKNNETLYIYAATI